MKLIIRKNEFSNILISITIAIFFFSSTCFWEEKTLRWFLISGIIIMVVTLITMFSRHVSLNRIINTKVIWWILINFIIFEVYGLFILKAGSFNWDFIAFNGILLVCVSILCLPLTTEQIISSYITACKMGIFATAIYMYSNGMLKISEISFGTRLGDTLSGNVNTVATCFGIMFLPVYYSVIDKKHRTIFGIVTAVIALICMLLTGSKKALLVLILCFFMTLFVYKKPIKYFVIPIVVMAGVYAIFNIPVLYNTVGFRVVDMLATFGIGSAITRAHSTSTRSNLIVMGLKSFWNHPLFGGGMNYFQYINNSIYYAHNNYVEILNDFGIIGLLIHYGLPFRSLHFFIKNKKRVQSGKESIYIFCSFLVIMKLILDIAMVSFSSLGIYYLPFLIPIIIMYKERCKN